jgi:nickel transport protein
MILLRIFFLFCLVGVTVQTAVAHKVILSIYSAGAMIEGEIGFSNGDMAAQALVEVFDIDGKQLGQVTTNDDGFFVFEPKAGVRHVFRADLGAGHVAQAILYEEDLQIDLRPESQSQIESTQNRTKTASLSEFSAQQRDVIAEAVRSEIRPLQKELAAYKEKNDLQTILGALGYILGLCGIGFYFIARRRLKDDTNAD